MRCIIIFLVSVLLTHSINAMTWQPEPTTCFICHENNDKSPEQKTLAIVCKTYHQTYNLHEFCLRTWFVATKAFMCPCCKKHSIPVPYRCDDTNWEPSPEELCEKYAVLLPVLGLGLLMHMVVLR